MVTRSRRIAAALATAAIFATGCESVDADVELSREEALTAYHDERNKRWAFQTSVKSTAKDAELLRGDRYKLALDQLRALRRKLDASQDPKEASLLLDEMSRTILEARRVLWEREEIKLKKND